MFRSRAKPHQLCILWGTGLERPSHSKLHCTISPHLIPCRTNYMHPQHTTVQSCPVRILIWWFLPRMSARLRALLQVAFAQVESRMVSFHSTNCSRMTIKLLQTNRVFKFAFPKAIHVTVKWELNWCKCLVGNSHTVHLCIRIFVLCRR